MKKIAVLVSGGVDSSVALALLKAQGHDVTAFYLKIWLEDELSYLGQCPWEEDLSYAQAVCDKLDVPLRIVSMQKVYWEKVVAYTIEQVKLGNTPNPDVLCNQQVKFGAFYEAVGSEFDFIATGHYAQIEHTVHGAILKQAADPVKDQTYFLTFLSQVQLQRALFPIGHLVKDQVRDLAAKLELPTAVRKDSQGICFLGKFKFKDFLHAHLGNRSGDLIEHETGKKVGTHDGFWYYTIGQRQGIGLSGGPWYVVAKDPAHNIVYISKQYTDVAVGKHGFVLKQFNKLYFADLPVQMHVRFRHGPALHEAVVVQKEDQVVVTLVHAVAQGIAQGQFGVLYQGDVCWGGGIIESVF